MKPVRTETGKGYFIGTTLYKRKKDVVVAIRHVIRSYKSGESVSQTHFAFLLNLLAHHAEGPRMVGSGVARFEVRQVPGYEQVSAFWVIRSDGSESPWSFMRTIYPEKPFARFRKVCRDAVADQVREFRQAWLKQHAAQGRFVCPVMGSEFSVSRAHVDHEPPDTLDALVRAFVAERGLDVSRVDLHETEGHGIGYQFGDAVLSAAWQSYHRVHAKLRLVSATANLSEVKKTSRSVRCDGVQETLSSS